MKKTRFKEEQMVKILREADQAPVAEVAKRHGVSVATICGWRQRFGKLEATDVKHLRRLEQENPRLKKLVAERDLELEVMKEIERKNMVSAPARHGHRRVHPGMFGDRCGRRHSLCTRHRGAGQTGQGTRRSPFTYVRMKTWSSSRGLCYVGRMPQISTPP